MTSILYEIVYFGLDFIMILLLLMNLHEIQMSVMRQIECFVPIYNAVHDTRIVDNLGKFILHCFTCMYVICYTCTFGAIGTLKMICKMLEFCLKTNVVWLSIHDDYKYINIMLLQWLEVVMPHKISENMYKYIYNAIDTLKLDCFTYGIEFLPDLGWFVLNWFNVTMCTLAVFLVKQVSYKCS